MTAATIENIAFGGEGIARIDGLAVFVPFTAPQDNVLVEIVNKKKTFAFGKMLSVLKPSPYRISPLCPYYGECGGCQFQHITYEAQLEIKRSFIEDALKRIGKIEISVPPITPSPEIFGYRRHITLKMQCIGANWTGGFSSISHETLEVASCHLLEISENSILQDIQKTIAQFAPVENGLGTLKILKENEGTFLLAFQFSSQAPPNLENIASDFCHSNSRCAGVVFRSQNKSQAIGSSHLEFTCANLTFFYSPFGFVQNHPVQSERLYKLVQSWARPSQKILDLFCGIGVTTLLSAQYASEAIGIEINEDAVMLAKQNALYNQCMRAQFFCAPVKKALTHILSDYHPDCIIINPPRTGIEKESLMNLATKKPKTFIYISCYPPTLARDLSILKEQGYEIRSIQGFDMFPHTTHVETAVFLSR